MTEYRSTLRLKRRFLFLLPLCLAGFGVGLWQAILVEDYHAAGRAAVLALLGAALAIGLCTAHVFRLHRWTLGPEGIAIREGPRVLLTGLPRRGFVAWTDIAALEVSGEHALRTLHLITRDGQRWRIAQRMIPNPQSRFNQPDPDAMLDDLEAAIRARVAGVRPALPPTMRTLAFFETRGGLIFLVFAFLLSVPFAAGTIWMLWEGGLRTPNSRNTYDALALFLFGPIVTGWALIARWRSRRAILRERAGQGAPT